MKARPRVIVMIAEQNVGKNGFSYWWGAKGFVSDMDILQNALIKSWQPRGFKFVDPAMLGDALTVKGALPQSGAQQPVGGPDRPRYDADIAIVGKVLVTDGGVVMKGVDMRTYNAVGTLRVLNVDHRRDRRRGRRDGDRRPCRPERRGRAAIQALAKKRRRPGTPDLNPMDRAVRGGSPPGAGGHGGEERQDGARDRQGYPTRGSRGRSGPDATSPKGQGLLFSARAGDRNRLWPRPRGEDVSTFSTRNDLGHPVETRRTGEAVSGLGRAARWAALASLLVSVMGVGPAEAKPKKSKRARPARVSWVEGRADFLKASSSPTDAKAPWRRLRTGSVVQPGETLRTGPKSRVELTFADGSKVRLASDTTVTVDEARFGGARPATDRPLRSGWVGYGRA